MASPVSGCASRSLQRSQGSSRPSARACTTRTLARSRVASCLVAASANLPAPTTVLVSPSPASVPVGPPPPTSFLYHQLEIPQTPPGIACIDITPQIRQLLQQAST